MTHMIQSGVFLVSGKKTNVVLGLCTQLPNNNQTSNQHKKYFSMIVMILSNMSKHEKEINSTVTALYNVN
jgi:hypothetical protein